MSKKILIVEDDSFLQGLISRKLKSDNIDVFIASDTPAGLKLIEGGLVPDLVLLDLLLPKQDGFEFLATMRTKAPLKSTPVIVFTNLSDEKDIKKAKDLGITDYLVKANFTLDELMLKIKAILK